jgi:hypothetical protein
VAAATAETDVAAIVAAAAAAVTDQDTKLTA